MTTRKHVPNRSDLGFWTNDGSPIPDWVQTQITGEVSPNGTFLIKTPIGAARVHVGNIVIGDHGQLWSRSPDEASEFIEALKAESTKTVAAIGPGKAAQFGARGRATRINKGEAERKISYRRPVGSMPSIEWVHTSELTVDQSYQRSIDNDGSRRLIAGIATNFDWRLCAPLVVSRRTDGSKVIIDGQH